MNRLSFHRRHFLSLTTVHRRSTATTIRRSSTHTRSPIQGKSKSSLSKAKPNRRQWIPIAPPIAQFQNPKNPNFNSREFSKLCELLTNKDLNAGPVLENVLNQAGMNPDEVLLLEIFNHLDSSPKPLFTLFHWAEKQPGYQFSVAVFNAMVNALGKARDFDSAWSLILDNIKASKSPNLDTFAIMIRRYARAGMSSPAIRTYEFASGLDFFHALDSERNLLEILLDSLSKEGLVRVATEYFEKRKGEDPSWIPSTRVYNILLNGWFRSRKLKKAERLWMEMKRENIKPSIVTYGTLVEGYCRMRRIEIAMELISEMKMEGLEPNAIIYNPVIDALGEAGRFKDASDMMERFSVMESGPTVSTYNSLVKGFCKAGDLQGASKILKLMIDRGALPSMTTYNYFFRHFSKFGKIEEGLNLYTKIIESGYEPDRLTYHLLVKMLCEQGRLNLSMQIIKEMRARGYDLDLATATMLIHLLLKVHQFDMASGEFEAMIRRGLVPQYLTYEKMSAELRNQGMTNMAEKLSVMMASVPHSRNLPNTYVAQVDPSHAKRLSVIHKAEAMSDILKTCNNPRKLVKLRNPLENAVSSGNRLVDDITKRVNSSEVS